MTSFTNPNVEYHTTAHFCDCKDRTINHHGDAAYSCKHMRKQRRIDQGLPLTVSAARAARIERNRATAAAYYRMSFAVYEF